MKTWQTNRTMYLALLVSLTLFSCTQSTGKKEGKDEKEINKGAVTKKKFLKRPGYQLEYPYNWTIDSTEKDYDIDAYISIESPSGSSFVTFMLFNSSIDEKEQVEEQIKEHLKVTMKNGEVNRFEKWGAYNGQGATIKGKLLGVFKGELKVFIHATDSSSFLFLSQVQDDVRLIDEESVTLIENSFRLK